MKKRDRPSMEAARWHAQLGAELLQGMSRQAFTLIELLVVIVIIASLFAVGVPVFNNMMHRGISTGVPTLVTTLRLARQHAITHRKNVYILFPGSFVNYPDDFKEYALRSYAVVEVTPGQSTETARYVTDWKTLPQGLYFEETETGKGNNVFESWTPASNARFPFPNDSGAPRAIPAVRFSPNGQSRLWGGATWSQTDSHLYIRPGVRNPGEIMPTWIIPENTTGTIVRIFEITGVVDVKKY
ncbi:MAG: prepilin-type N-terminal cleavage/methylation domain-containing protein [Kiritimatiellae bacterium]|nr:prepilin-type N-terminal cleavage/methylation domain-containing protein [Kiritimatiellia bacterium]